MLGEITDDFELDNHLEDGELSNAANLRNLRKTYRNADYTHFSQILAFQSVWPSDLSVSCNFERLIWKSAVSTIFGEHTVLSGD